MEVCDRSAAADKGDMDFCDEDALSSVCCISWDNIIDMARSPDIGFRDAAVRPCLFFPSSSAC